MPGDVALDKLQEHYRHFEALSCGCGLKAVMKLRWDIDVHAFYSCSFLLDLTHLPSLEMSIWDCE